MEVVVIVLFLICSLWRTADPFLVCNCSHKATSP